MENKKIWDYYCKKRKTEDEDTAINMVLQRFWFNRESLIYFLEKLENHK